MKHDVEFIEDEHIYLVDGIITPSITQILGRKFNSNYAFVSDEVLMRAAEYGTKVHKAIEDYCKTLKNPDMAEVDNFIAVCKKKNLSVIDNEITVVLEDCGEVVGAGRLDLVMEKDGELGLADIKTSSRLDRKYLFYQLNLYAKAYEQCYGKEIKWLAGLHIREDKKTFSQIDLDYEKAREILDEIG